MPLYDNLAAWQSASAAAREQAAQELARSLPDGFAFDGLHRFGDHGRRNEIAQFSFGAARFSLVPGGQATLGFDAASWTPTPAMLESWEDTAQAYRIEETLHEHIGKRTSPVRSVTLPALLVETRAAEVGWRPIDPASEKVQTLLQKFPGGVTEFSGIATRVTVNGDEVTAEQSDETDSTHAAVAAKLAAQGFRLPTEDEWEYLCSAGAATLFRWGDHAPCDHYPAQNLAGALARERDFDRNRIANLFGLYIAVDPYQIELTTEASLTRGGDGGCAICGGAGFLAGWLPLASAWNDPDFCRPEEEIALGYSVGRRVLALDGIQAHH